MAKNTKNFLNLNDTKLVKEALKDTKDILILRGMHNQITST